MIREEREFPSDWSLRGSELPRGPAGPRRVCALRAPLCAATLTSPLGVGGAAAAEEQQQKHTSYSSSSAVHFSSFFNYSSLKCCQNKPFPPPQRRRDAQTSGGRRTGMTGDYTSSGCTSSSPTLTTRLDCINRAQHQITSDPRG